MVDTLLAATKAADIAVDYEFLVIKAETRRARGRGRNSSNWRWVV